jgi:hypothetical protein
MSCGTAASVEKGQRTCGLSGAPVAGVVLELMTAATAREEVCLVERAPSGDASLLAVMDDEHHVGRLARSARSDDASARVWAGGAACQVLPVAGGLRPSSERSA